MDKFSEFMGASSKPDVRRVSLKEESKEVVDYHDAATTLGSASASSMSNARSDPSIVERKSSRQVDADTVSHDVHLRKAKLKRYLKHEGSTSTASSEMVGLVDFSTYRSAAIPIQHEDMAFDRTSMASAGLIEYRSSFEEREMKRERREQEAMKKSKQERKSSFGHVLVRPLRINLKSYQIEELKEAFNILENGMELIDISHISTIIRACGFEQNNEEIKEILEEIKPVNEGFLNLNELIRVFEIKLKRQDPLEDIRRAFKVFDWENAGVITLNNLKEISKCVGEELHEEEMKEMISAADKTHSGKVTMDNFVKLITRKDYFDY
uniref:Caltractin n=1 Tax=Lygus hesperus TaxID=30085 RepID=A0A0A9ZIZ1_LYGHE